MSKTEIFDNLTAACGTGVLVECNGISSKYKPYATILAYINYFGATGTFKDGLAEGMIRLAESSGELKKGAVIVDVADSNFSVALILAGRRTGHNVVCCVTATTPESRCKALTDLGAELVMCNAFDGRTSCVARAKSLAASHDGYFMDYAANDFNPEYHRRITGPSILKKCDGELDFLVTTVGSGGMITGCGEYIKAWTNGVQIVGVEPSSSRVISGFTPSRHGMEGAGLPFLPEVYNEFIVDKIIPVTTGDGKKFANELALYDGIPACTTSGAAMGAALEIAMNPENTGKKIIVIIGGSQTVS